MTTVQDSSAVTSLFGAGAATTTKNGTEAAQDRFLSLLVAQMKNQDPLNPLDNAEVTSQLAQLSTVQGIENMNATLETLAASLGVNQMSQAASLIGRGVLVPGNEIAPGEIENIVGFELSGPADQVTVSIQDATGKTVRTLELGPREAGVDMVAWDGLLDGGAAAGEGPYQFTVAATQGDRTLAATALHLGLVNSVSQNAQGVQLNLNGDDTALYADIRQIF
jgi:flagellar basal-body rod modification protein FlgD